MVADLILSIGGIVRYTNRSRVTGSINWALIVSGFAYLGCSSDGSDEAANAAADIVHIE